jgi:hypothetical protein
MRIHESKSEAMIACAKYATDLAESQEKYGVWEENEDSCTQTFIYAKYLDKDGLVKTHCHS